MIIQNWMNWRNMLPINGHPDFLDLSHQNVCSIEALVDGGDVLLNKRQCLDLKAKLSKTVHSIQKMVSHCEESTGKIFGPALQDLYRIMEKAKLLVNNCCKEDWVTEAIFQIGNAKDFQVILLEVGLCYHTIYEQAKGISGEWNFEHLGQGSSTFRPAPICDVCSDQDSLKQRLEDLVRSQQNCPKQSVQQYLQYCLARYLLVTWECIFQQSKTNEFDLSSVMLCMKEMESTETWGKGNYLGHGSFGGVSSATWLGIPCAKKTFDEVDESLFLKEAGILFHLNHPNIVKFFCCGYGQEGTDCFIAMELMEHSLAKLILIQSKRKIPFPPHIAIDIIVQIARAMCYLHDMGVAHRDLKPHNVVVNQLTSPHHLDQYCVKLVDFGLSKVKVKASKSNTMTKPGIGTTRYRAPEAHPNAYSSGHGKVKWFKADVYSFGVMCAHLLTLKEPFENMNLGQKYVELVSGQLKLEVPAAIYPEKLVALLNDCWDTRPSSRPNFTEICMKLEGIRHKLLRTLPLAWNGGFEQFIQIEVKEHSAIWRQHIVNSDKVIVLKPTSDSIITSGMEKMNDTIMLDSPSTTHLTNFYSTTSGESLPWIDEVANKDIDIAECASTSEMPARHESMMQSRSIYYSAEREIDFLPSETLQVFDGQRTTHSHAPLSFPSLDIFPTYSDMKVFLRPDARFRVSVHVVRACIRLCALYRTRVLYHDFEG